MSAAIGLDEINEAGRRLFRIYEIKERRTGLGYVGVTALVMNDRFLGHRQDACRDRRRRPGGLADAIRRSAADGLVYLQAFSIRELATTTDPEEARRLEAEWIERRRTRVPDGFNQMPGGRSLGGPLNSCPVTVEHPIRGTLDYPSLSVAIIDANAEHERQRLPTVGAEAVYARIRAGWTPAQALGLVHRTDGRRIRASFTWAGHEYDTLRDASIASGVPIATLRSRLHRARTALHAPPPEIATDRRRSGPARSPVPTSSGILVPAPPGHVEALVTLEAFARLAKVPKSTVTYRYRRLEREGRSPDEMPADELHAFLVGSVDRRILLDLRIAPSEVWSDGIRSLIARLFATPAVECRRVDRIGGSAIRARLRTLPGWPDRLSAVAIRWAFGFEAQKPD